MRAVFKGEGLRDHLAVMAKKKKSRSSRSSPLSHSSQQSEEMAESGGNPTIGGCSGNTGSPEERGRLREEQEAKRTEEERTTQQGASFPSILDLPPPTTSRGQQKVEENWWRGEGEEAKCLQAWSIWSEALQKANVYLANGEALVMSAAELAAGYARARASVSWSPEECSERIVSLPRSVAPQVLSFFEQLIQESSSTVLLPLWPWPLALKGEGIWGSRIWATMTCVRCGRLRRVALTAGKEVDQLAASKIAQCALLQGVQCHEDVVSSNTLPMVGSRLVGDHPTSSGRWPICFVAFISGGIRP